jgi:hypothetical protein
MGDHGHQHTKAEDAATGSPRDAISPGAIRNFILWTIAILMLAAWHGYDGFKHPESRTPHLLRAVLILLLGALAWVRRLTLRTLVIKPRWGRDTVNHWTAAFAPLIVVLAFGLSQLVEAHHQAARKELTLKKQAWQQAVQRQRESSDLASKQYLAAITKQGDAFKISLETSEPLKLPDGKPGFRLTPDAMRKLTEAKEEVSRAFERDKAERERLLQLQSEFWHYR